MVVDDHMHVVLNQCVEIPCCCLRNMPTNKPANRESIPFNLQLTVNIAANIFALNFQGV